MAELDMMERFSHREMWFELQPLNWKIRRETKALNGGHQACLRPPMCWSLFLRSSGTREPNIGGFTEAQKAPGKLLVWSGDSFLFPSVSQIAKSTLSGHQHGSYECQHPSQNGLRVQQSSTLHQSSLQQAYIV